MKKLNQLVASAVLLAIAGSAQATLIDFQNMANGSVGESAWTTFNTVTDGGSTAANINITSLPDSTADPAGSYVYFDSKWNGNSAGLGVCSSGLAFGATANTSDPFSTGTNGGNTRNVCGISSDDNVNKVIGDVAGEALVFTFNENTSINKIWVNNNHDGGSLAGNTILLSVNGGAGVQASFTGSPVSGFGYGFTLDSLALGSSFGVNDKLTISYDTGAKTANQFYVSAMDVPEPGILALLGLGLVGIGFARRNKK